MIEFIKYGSNISSLFWNKVDVEDIKRKILKGEIVSFYGYYEIAKDAEGNDVYLKIKGPTSDKYTIDNLDSLSNYLGLKVKDNWKSGRFERTITFLNPESKDKMDKISQTYDMRLFISGKLMKTYSDSCIEIYEG